MQLTAELKATGGNTTGFQISPDILDQLDAGKRPKVVVTVNGHTWRSSIAPMRGEYWLGVSAANRSAAGVGAGDLVTLSVELDSAPRSVDVPPELAAALAADQAAQAAWNQLSFTHQREHAEAIATATSSDTRQRRVEKALAMLRGR